VGRDGLLCLPMSTRAASRREPTVKVSAKIPVSLERALKQHALDEGRSLANVIRLALHELMKKNGRVL
jgi:hypothetical protein